MFLAHLPLLARFWSLLHHVSVLRVFGSSDFDVDICFVSVAFNAEVLVAFTSVFKAEVLCFFFLVFIAEDLFSFSFVFNSGVFESSSLSFYSDSFPCDFKFISSFLSAFEAEAFGSLPFYFKVSCVISFSFASFLLLSLFPFCLPLNLTFEDQILLCAQ